MQRELGILPDKMQAVQRGSNEEKREQVKREVLNAHELTKLGLFFFKAYCLHTQEVPPVNHDTMLACLTGSPCNPPVEQRVKKGI